MFGSNYNDYRMSLGYKPKSLDEIEWHFYKTGPQWEYKFAYLPKRCNLTGKRIWLKKAYRGEARYRAGDFHILYEYRWHDRHEHLIWTLKGPYG